MMRNRSSLSTALAEAATRIGDRWTLLVVAALLDGPRRFGDLQGDVPGIATNILTRRLKHLEHEGLVVARPYSHRPPRVDYQLTGAGRELADALRLLANWGARNSEDAEPKRHEACGTPLELQWHCPTCQRNVSDAEDEIRYF